MILSEKPFLSNIFVLDRNKHRQPLKNCIFHPKTASFHKRVDKPRRGRILNSSCGFCYIIMYDVKITSNKTKKQTLLGNQSKALFNVGAIGVKRHSQTRPYERRSHRSCDHCVVFAITHLKLFL